MSLIGVKHGEGNCERVSCGVGLRLWSFGRRCRTACGSTRNISRGRGAARVARAGGVFLSAALALTLSLSPAVAHAEGVTEPVVDNPYPETSATLPEIVDGSINAFADGGVVGLLQYWGHTSVDWTGNDTDMGDGFWGSGGGDFGGGTSSSGSSSSSGGGSGTSTEDVPTVLTTAQLVTVGETSNGTHKSYTDYTYTGNGLYSRNSTDNPYLHTHVQITTNPRVTSVQIRTSPDFVRAINSYRSAGYDILCIVDLTNGNSDERTRIHVIAIQSGCWHYAEEGYYGKYYIDQNAKYASILDNVSVITYWDGSNVFCDTNGRSGIVNYLSTQTRTSYYYYAMISSTGSGDYVSVLYADGSTGTGGASTGSGDGGSSGDTYNTTNNYNTTTTYNNLDLDLSPITQRQDNLMRTVNQIGKDVNKLVYGLDKDLLRIFQVLLLDFSVDRQNGVKLQSILDELTDGYLQDIAADIDLIAKELTNLQSNSAMRSIKGFLYAIYQELDDWPKGATSGGGSSDPVTVDLSTIESKLDTIISKMGQGDGGDTVINNDNDQTLGEQIGEKMNEVKERFPFSIPWDVMYILGLVRAEPIAPQFDMPVIGSDENIHVDLSQWEPVAVVTRNGTLVLFGLGLALRSRNLIRTWGGSDD